MREKTHFGSALSSIKFIDLLPSEECSFGFIFHPGRMLGYYIVVKLIMVMSEDAPPMLKPVLAHGARHWKTFPQ